MARFIKIIQAGKNTPTIINTDKICVIHRQPTRGYISCPKDEHGNDPSGWFEYIDIEVESYHTHHIYAAADNADNLRQIDELLTPNT